MEEKQEKIVANETVGTSTFLKRDFSISMNHIEQEACRSVVSTNSERPSTSKGNNEPERWSHELECEGKESKNKIVGEVKMSMDMGSLNTRDDFNNMPSIFQNVKSNQSNVDHVTGCLNNINSHQVGNPYKALFSSSIVSAHAMASSSNITSGNNILEASSFPRGFLKATTMGVLHESPSAFNESMTTPTARYKAHQTLMAQNEETHDEIVSEEREMPHCGINLRQWLESNGMIANKNDKLCLFRKIVEIVDFAHSKGIALMDLRPSSFIMLETGDVEYIGLLMETTNHDTIKKRGLELKIVARGKLQKIGGDDMARPEKCPISRFVEDKAKFEFNHGKSDMENSRHSIWNSQSSIYEGTSTGNSWLAFDNAQLEKSWYAFPDEFKTRDLLSSNIYALGLLFFEFLCHFGSIKAHSTIMLDLRQRILPPYFLSECPKEAGFCFWLLHPKPSSRPTTREILQSELICESVCTNMRKDETPFTEMVDDVELNLLLHFLDTLKQHKQNKESNLLESIEFLNTDIKVVEKSQAFRKHLDMKDHRGAKDPCSTSRMNEFTDKILGNITELENVYFSLRSNLQISEIPDMDRSDKDVLRKRDRLSSVQAQNKHLKTEEKQGDRVGMFFDGICNFVRFNKFEVCGTLRNDNILNSDSAISSLSFDRDEDFIAAAGVSKKIKIFELASLLDDFVDVQYPVLELTNKSKFSCICWNNYIRSYLASTDYDGLVQIWDVSIGQELAQYNEHQRRAWSVDFSQVDPTIFASGGDDCSLRIWSTNERNSTCTIQNPANICCVQFSPYSSHLLAFGSADYKIYCYDLRHTRIPWCTLAGHDNTVSYVRFLDSETLVSASTDNTLKTWNLNKTSLKGLSSSACSLTLSGHTNKKNFVGLTVLDGYIACGSETNEVYAYYKSLPMPITSHKFGYIDPVSGYEVSDGDGRFVSSVCWRRNSQMLVAANSSGSMEILRMV